MMNRRALLAAGGAGAAALALPSLPIALAQGLGTSVHNEGPDPIAQELITQFQRMTAGLKANPPRGSAREGAAAYRMLAAWGRANNVTAHFKKHITDAVNREGHHNLVSRMATTDWAKEAKRIGVPLPVNFQSPTYTQIAKAIGYIKGGFSIETEWQRRARVLTKKGAQIDRMIALRNGRDPDAMIRRVAQEQDVDGDGIPDSIDGYDDRCNQEGDCTQNPDGSFHCVFTSQCQPTGGGYGDNDPEGCDEAELFALLTSLFFTGAAQYYGLVWLMYLALIDQGYFGVVLYMANCL